MGKCVKCMHCYMPKLTCYMPKLLVSLHLYFSAMASAYMAWSHLEQLYECDRGKATGFTMVPKLKFEHIKLTYFSKMRVDLPAEVNI